MKEIVMTAAVAAALTSAFAQPARHGGYPANAQGAVTSHGAHHATSREEALRECTAVEQKTSPTIRDSNLSMFEYRACMQEHGQSE